MTETFTRNFQLTKPDFRDTPWHDEINDNFDKIDAVMFRQITAASITVWENSTDYQLGDFVVDPDDVTFWFCAVDHTSRASGTMADDRGDFPSYWEPIALSLNPRGVWTPDTAYTLGDIVSYPAEGITAICIESHVSSSAPDTISDDSVYWDFIVEISAANTPFTPSGTIVATNVQAAIQELNGDTITLSSLIGDNAADLLKDYVVNGHHMVSQENGSTAITTTGFIVDQWRIATAGTTGTFSAAQVDSASTRNSEKAIRVTVTAADAAVAAGDLVFVETLIEGNDVSDLFTGSAAAKTVTVGFNIKAPAGTWPVTIQNSARSRSYTAHYTISAEEANIKVRKYVTIALDTAGSWLTGTNLGMRIVFGLMVGATYQASIGSWQAGEFYGGVATSNLFGTNAQVWEISDVSMVQGAVDCGPRPANYQQTLLKCQRYFWQIGSTTNLQEWVCSTSAFTSTDHYGGVKHPVEMRTAPSISVSSTAHFTLLITGATPAISNIQSYVVGTQFTGLQVTTAAATAGHAGLFRCNNASARLKFTARF